mmetsp:Transcript_39843/g.86977  ORF Transcript_39843/g.86977 Transcript_39843/m.86977 type:complete len:182 (-) Transcript_39843:13-558(-)
MTFTEPGNTILTQTIAREIFAFSDPGLEERRQVAIRHLYRGSPPWEQKRAFMAQQAAAVKEEMFREFDGARDPAKAPAAPAAPTAPSRPSAAGSTRRSAAATPSMGPRSRSEADVASIPSTRPSENKKSLVPISTGSSRHSGDSLNGAGRSGALPRRARSCRSRVDSSSSQPGAVLPPLRL